MTLQQLKYFCKVAEVLHYTEAANSLFISQSGLSYSIAELEKKLGAPMFTKHSKKTALTKFGEEFLPYAKKALENIEEGSNRVKKMLTPESVINLGYIYSLSFGILSDTLADFRLKPDYDDISFNFVQGVSSVIIDKLKKYELDIALLADVQDYDLESIFVYEQELFVVMPKSHRLAEKEHINLHDIIQEDFVAISSKSSLRKCVDNVFHSVGATPRIRIQAEECNTIASFVSANFGISILPEIPSLDPFDIAWRSIEEKPFIRKINLVWLKSNKLSPVVQQFKDCLLAKLI